MKGTALDENVNCAWVMNILDNKDKSGNEDLKELFNTRVLPAYYPNDSPKLLEKISKKE